MIHAADLAGRRIFRVVDAVLHVRQALEKQKQRRLVLVGHVAIDVHGHDLVQAPRAGVACHEHLLEQRLIVVLDAARVEGNVGRHDFTPGSLEVKTAAEGYIHSRLAHLIHRRVTTPAISKRRQVLAALRARAGARGAGNGP